MKSIEPLIVVFVHGWSVSNLDTYGELPLCLMDEANKQGFNITIREIFLGRYISFHDEVKLGDISRAFDTAVKEQLADILKDSSRFICITHSTGGPVIRDWVDTYYENESIKCPMSHLIMLAPANYGSALAQLGKERVGRLKSWFAGKEPGQGVLDWLELGSNGAWQLNTKWIEDGEKKINSEQFFPFIITGQSIDRKFYDALNTYTGEIGSDGVVRVAAANLHSRYIKLVQPKPKKNKKGEITTDNFIIEEYKEAPITPLRIITRKSHSGPTMGIMASIKRNSKENNETIRAILECTKVKNKKDYIAINNKFKDETDAVQERELVEIEKRLLLSDREFIHDKFSMVIFKVTDTANQPVNDFDLLFTAGENSDPNHLPPGFAPDRQRNRNHPNTITYFFNFNIITGAKSVKDPVSKKVYRKKMDGIDLLGLIVNPRPDKGFVRYIPCKIDAKSELLEKALLPNGTTLIEICLQRIVDKEVFRLEKLKGDKMTELDFKDIEPTDQIVD